MSSFFSSSSLQQQQHYNHRYCHRRHQDDTHNRPPPSSHLTTSALRWATPIPDMVVASRSTNTTITTATTRSVPSVNTTRSSLGVRSCCNLSSSSCVDDDHTSNSREEQEDTERDQKAASLVQERIVKYQKQWKWLPFLRRNNQPLLNLQNCHVATLSEAVVKQMHDLKIERLSLAHNESMVVVPVTLVQGGACGHQNLSPFHNRSSTPLTSLEQLDLSKCQIVILPEAWDLPNLRQLDLSHNRIRDFPSKSILKGIPLLKRLNLYGNRLLHIPSFGSAAGGSNPTGTSASTAAAGGERRPSSKSLSLQPPLSLLSSSRRRNSANTTASSVLYLDGDLLTHLTWLNVGYNDLTDLPERLPMSLETLIACNNFLSRVPAALVQASGGSSSLRELDVSSNPISHPPPETCEAGLRAMRKYFDLQDACQHFAIKVLTDHHEDAKWRHELHRAQSQWYCQHDSASGNRRTTTRKELALEPSCVPVGGGGGGGGGDPPIPSYRIALPRTMEGGRASRQHSRVPGGAMVPEVVEFALSSRSNPFLSY